MQVDLTIAERVVALCSGGCCPKIVHLPNDTFVLVDDEGYGEVLTRDMAQKLAHTLQIMLAPRLNSEQVSQLARL